MEKWSRVLIKGEITNYEISNEGRCRNINKLEWKTQGVLKPKINRKSGYVQYVIILNGINYYKYAHRLVAEYFVNGDISLDVNHIDGNKQNNFANNLEWVTKKENMRHAFDNNLTSVNKPINQYDLEGNFINSYKSASEAARSIGVSERTISSSLNGINTNTAGFQWRFINDNKPIENISSFAKRHKVGVVQLTLDGGFIAQYDEIHKAYVAIGKTDNGVISQVCKDKRKKYLGFKWVYSYDYYKLVNNDIVYTHSSLK